MSRAIGRGATVRHRLGRNVLHRFLEQNIIEMDQIKYVHCNIYIIRWKGFNIYNVQFIFFRDDYKTDNNKLYKNLEENTIIKLNINYDTSWYRLNIDLRQL